MNQNAQPQPQQANQPQGKPKRGIIAFDLDGCVYLDEWRKGSEVAAYNRMHKDDHVNQFARKYLEDAFSKDIFVVFITERTVDLIIDTANQIVKDFQKDMGADFSIYMRPLDDLRPEIELKEEIINLVIAVANKNRTNVIGAFDNTPELVQMYRAHGITAHKLDAFGCFMDDGQTLPLITILEENAFDRFQDPTKSAPRPVAAQPAPEVVPEPADAPEPVALAEKEPEPVYADLDAPKSDFTPSKVLEAMAENLLKNAEALLSEIRLQARDK